MRETKDAKRQLMAAAALAKSGDRDALAATLTDLLDDPSKRQELIARGRSRVENYSWDACAEGVIHLYQRLC